MSTRVLIVEDDEAMSVALRDGFQYEGYAVTVANDGEAGLAARATASRRDLILLDVMLPKMTGLDICKQLRGGGNGMPIIMLTARGQEIDKVLGLKLGADDYITKPFGFMELLARAEAVLRRAERPPPAAPPETYRFGDVSVDFRRHEAQQGGRADRPLAARVPAPRLLHPAPGRDRHPREAPRHGLGLQRHPLHPHRRHAHRQAAQEDRGQPRRPQAHRHRPPAGVQVYRLSARAQGAAELKPMRFI